MSGDFLDSIPGLYKAFGSVKQFAVESDFTSRKKLDSIILRKMLLPADTTYQDLLNERELEELDSIFLRYFNVNSERSRANPNILTNSLQWKILEKESEKWGKTNRFLVNVSLSKNIDSKLIEMAKGSSYTLIELDTVEELDRLGILDWSILFSGTLQERAKEMLRSTMELLKDTALIELNRKVKEAYYEQNLALLKKLGTHPVLLKDENTKLIYYKLAIKRNIFWMDRILSAIHEQPTFIMVGALHLPGKQGVINLLREEGYTVTPVK
jgi:uncharacterized protein YbaP (TraB family)